MSRLVLVTLAMALVAGGVTSAEAGEMAKHSGRVVAIDVVQGKLILDEVGPRPPGGSARVMRRTIILTPTTDFLITLRANPPDGFPGQFIEGEFDRGDIEVGDMVTVDCLHDGSRLIAVRVTLLGTATP